MSAKRLAVVRVLAVTMLAGLIAGIAPEAIAVSGGITGRTNLSGGSGCTSCHLATADTAMTVTITGATTLNAGQSSTYTVTATKSGVANGTKMGLNAAASDSGSLSVVAGQPTILSSGEIVHSTSSGSLRTTTSNSATYQFTYMMPGGAAAGSTHTLYAVAVLGYQGGWNHAANFTVTTTAAVAATRYVNASTGVNTGTCSAQSTPCKTITYAMGQATAGNPGDLVSVAPGTYNLTLGEVFPITLKSGVQLVATGTAANTIIDAVGDTVKQGILASSSNTSSLARIQGFTIANGVSTPALGANAQGGALRIEFSSGALTVTNNIFSGNTARGYAGIGGSYPSGGQAYGGAIYATSASPTIANNVFIGNTAIGGDGVNNFGLSTTGGSAGAGQGGAIYISGGGTIVNSTFHGNQANGGRGGFSLGSGGSGGNATGGAVVSSGVTIDNNVFSNNSATAGAGGNGTPAGSAGIAGCGALYNSSALAVSNNLFSGNTENGAASTGDTFGSNSVRNLDPLFHLAPSNLRIRITSPAKAAGKTTGAPTTDFDGTTRPIPPSIGAFEATDFTAPVVYNLVLEGAQQVPPVVTSATGSGTATYNPVTRQLALNLAYSGLSSTETGAHIHGPALRGANAGVLFALAAGSPKTDTVTLTAAQETDLLAGKYYVNVHTTNNGGGELRAQIDTVSTSGNLTPSPTPLAFGGQSMNTTSPAMAVTLSNATAGAVTVSSVAVSTYFTVSHNCSSVVVGASCTANVTFTPTAQGSLTGTLTVLTSAGTLTVSLSGTGERSLVTHYYRSILRRAPDTGGKSFWEAEATRVQALGVNVNEVWFAMAGSFYFSTEYLALNRDNAGFVTDLYGTFFNRAPDTGGFNDWMTQLTAGMPREVVLASFMFSTEFANFTLAIFGPATTRKEIDTVVDFFRGLLARLPDDGGFAFWLQKFRAAQCLGGAAVNAEVESISSQFAQGAEYAARNRSNSQYVGDLYNAFLRRGGDLGGVQFWIGQVTTGAQTREAVRRQFVASTEFSTRVNAIIAQGCLP